jgi:hypothetical protein
MINQFDSNVYSEEIFNFTEAEHAAVMADGFEGYAEWSQELEAEAWRGSKPIGDILIKKACEHTTCSHFRCERSQRIGGIEV